MDSRTIGKFLVITENGSIFIPTDYRSASSGTCSGPDYRYTADEIVIWFGTDPIDIDLRSSWLNITL